MRMRLWECIGAAIHLRGTHWTEWLCVCHTYTFAARVVNEQRICTTPEWMDREKENRQTKFRSAQHDVGRAHTMTSQCLFCHNANFWRIVRRTLWCETQEDEYAVLCVFHCKQSCTCTECQHKEGNEIGKKKNGRTKTTVNINKNYATNEFAVVRVCVCVSGEYDVWTSVAKPVYLLLLALPVDGVFYIFPTLVYFANFCCLYCGFAYFLSLCCLR